MLGRLGSCFSIEDVEAVDIDGMIVGLVMALVLGLRWSFATQNQALEQG